MLKIKVFFNYNSNNLINFEIPINYYINNIFYNKAIFAIGNAFKFNL